MNWTITNNGQNLNLNDQTFIGEDFADFSIPYTAPQIPSALPDSMIPFFTQIQSMPFYVDGSTEPTHITWRELGFRASKRSIPATDDTDNQLVDIDFEILQVNERSPTGVDALTLRLLQDEHGVLNLLEVVRIPADGSAPDVDSDTNAPHPPADQKEEQTFEVLPISPIPSAPNAAPLPAIKHTPPHIVNCRGMPLKLCQMKYMIGKKLEAMHHALSSAASGRPVRPHHRPCGHKRPHGLDIKGGVPKLTHPDGTPVTRPHHHGRHGMAHKTCRMLRRFLFGIVIPVLIGMAAGMTASLAGMVVGTGLAMLWFKLRGGKRAVGVKDMEEGEAFETEGLMDEKEGRDSVDTLPAYVEKE